MNKSIPHGLYHSALSKLPQSVDRFVDSFSRVRYTNHALSEADKDLILLPLRLKVELHHVVEAEFEAGHCVKVVVRQQYNDEYDLVVVLREPSGGQVLVVTCWLNHVADKHGTLDRSRYRRWVS